MNEYDFDKHFSDTEKLVKGGIKVALVAVVVQIVLGAAAVIGLVWVAVHFLSKGW